MTLEAALRARVAEVCAQAEMEFGWAWDTEIEVRLDLRGRSLGQAIVKRNGVFSTKPYTRIIRLNLHTAEQDLDYCLKQTIPHEVAHHAESRMYRQLSHSRTWRSMFRALGGNGDTKAKEFKGEIKPGRRVRRAVYILPQFGRIAVTPHQHDLIQNGLKAWVQSTREMLTPDRYSHEELC